MRRMFAEQIKVCTDMEELENAQEDAYRECAEYNCCDPGCLCWNADGDCDLNLITKRIKELGGC